MFFKLIMACSAIACLIDAYPFNGLESSVSIVMALLFTNAIVVSDIRERLDAIGVKLHMKKD
jgi:hypothetical protein